MKLKSIPLLLLLPALMLVLTACGGGTAEPLPTYTPYPTYTTVPPTATSVPPTATSITEPTSTP